MQVLVSFCNLKAKGCPSLGLLNVDTFEFNVLALPEGVARNGGLTGLAASDQCIFAVAQSLAGAAENTSPVSTLLVFDRKNFALCGCYEFRIATDVHSLWVSESRLLAVSTGTDEVVELSLRGSDVASERIMWRPDSAGARENHYHLNAIYGWDAGILISGFGKKTAATRDTARDGFIANIATGERIASGIDQPHSVTRIGTGMAWCESRKAAVRLLSDEGERVLVRLPGYTRGLCTVGEWLFAGTSVGRKHSRSTGHVNNPAEIGVPDGRCTITQLSLATLEAERTIDLSTYAQEIYDLLPVKGSSSWPFESEVRWRDTAIRTLVEELDARATWAKRTKDALTRSEADLSAARDQLAEQEATRKEIETTRREIEEVRSLVLKQTDQRNASTKALAGLQIRLDGAEAELGFLRDVALTAVERWAPELAQSLRYRQLILRIRAVIDKFIPAGSIVVVISKGDEELLQLGGREAWHFPQTEDGKYAGSYPACGTAAVAHMEALRARGADYLIIPETSLWWLDHYPDFAAHLGRYCEVMRQQDVGRIFALGEPVAVDAARAAEHGRLEDLLARCRERTSEEPAILDWNSGLDLRRIAARCAVFIPPEPGPVLPYLDQSIDIVAIPPDPSLDKEARRVARIAVLTAVTANGSGRAASSFRVDWLSDSPADTLLTTTLVVPCLREVQAANQWWESLIDNLPGEFAGEIVTDADVAAVSEALARRPIRRIPPVRQINRPCGETDACFFNRAVKDVTAELLVFLTPGLVPLNGWLSPLCDLLRRDLRASVVGGKVFARDGRLEEAGVTVFADGAVQGFGSGDYQVEDLLYEFVREVPCCSAHVLATRRELFEELGGFDPAFRTSVYTFADYCFQARGRGRRIVYQPESQLVLSRRPVRGGADAADADTRDRELFRTKWKSELGAMPCPRPIWDRNTWHTLAGS